MKKKATVRDIWNILIELGDAIARLGESLPAGGDFPGTSAGPGARSRAARASARRGAARSPRRPMSPKLRRSLELQGRYMAAVRSLSEPNKKKVRALRAQKGVPAAISEALRLQK